MSLSVKIGNATDIAGNLFCTKIPVGTCEAFVYNYFECDKGRKWMGKYFMIFNEDIVSSSNDLNFHGLYIMGYTSWWRKDDVDVKTTSQKMGLSILYEKISKILCNCFYSISYTISNNKVP